MAAKLRIVVGGYIVGYPLGGMTWHHLSYLLGLREIGHEVSYLEDGAYNPPFDPTTGTSGVPDYGVSYLRRTFARFGLEIPFHYRFGDYTAGLSIAEMDDAMRRADLLICVSGVTPIEWRPMPRRSLVIDTDPVFTQLRMGHEDALARYYRSFTACATFGKLIGTPHCTLPTHGIEWIPTNQPIGLGHWPAAAPHGGGFTTIGKWESDPSRRVERGSNTYHSSKAAEWMKLIDLPSRSPATLRITMAGMPNDVRALFQSRGWSFADPTASSIDCDAFQRFIHDSAGELTVAKEAYAAIPSGWFSDRSAAYLASGRPVVTQSTGFEHWLPVGEGLFSFNTADEAAAALEQIAIDPARHCRAARSLAERLFDSAAVLRDLIHRVM